MMLLCVIGVASYLLVFDAPAYGYIPADAINMEDLEQELELGRPVRIVAYKSPIDGQIYAIPVANKSQSSRDYIFEAHVSRAHEYQRLWTWADEVISQTELFPEAPEVDEIMNAMQTAKIVNVDLLNLGKYVSGTSEKWIVTMEGGQKAMMKLVW